MVNDLTRTSKEGNEKFARIEKDNDNLKLETNTIRDENNEKVRRSEKELHILDRTVEKC